MLPLNRNEDADSRPRGIFIIDRRIGKQFSKSKNLLVGQGQLVYIYLQVDDDDHPQDVAGRDDDRGL